MSPARFSIPTRPSRVAAKCSSAAMHFSISRQKVAMKLLMAISPTGSAITTAMTPPHRPVTQIKAAHGGEVVEELLHCLAVGVRHDQGEAVVGAWLDRREDVGEGEALVAQPRWALPATPPDVARPSLLAN